MAYKCPQCDYVSEQAGNCPTCNIATVEVKEEATEVKPAENIPGNIPGATKEGEAQPGEAK